MQIIWKRVETAVTLEIRVASLKIQTTNKLRKIIGGKNEKS